MIRKNSDESYQLQLIKKYIDLHYDEPEIVLHKAEDSSEDYEYQEPRERYSIATGASHSAAPEVSCDELPTVQVLLEGYGIDEHLEPTFSQRLRGMMEERSLSAPEVYKHGNLDKSLFSKLMTDPAYSPSKDTAIQVAFGLRLPLKQAKELIGSAGYQLSRSIRRDVALECCFKSGYNNVVRINILLDELGLQPLGRQGR